MKEVAACDFPYNKLFVNCLFLWESATGEKDVLCMYCTRYWAQTHAQHKNVTHRIRKCKLIPPMYVVHFPDRPPPYCHVIMYCTYVPTGATQRCQLSMMAKFYQQKYVASHKKF